MCEALKERIKKENEKNAAEVRAKTLKDTAKNLLQMGILTVEQIAKSCNLTVDEVNALKNSV